jgi:Domain of unknown function (DUF4349)
MRRVTVWFSIAILVIICGCNLRKKPIAGTHSMPAADNEVVKQAIPEARRNVQLIGQGKADTIGDRIGQSEQLTSSLHSVDSAQASAQAIERKIIRNAEMTIQTDSPNDGQRKIAAIAEKHGGFVVTSESRENQGNAQSSPATTITIVARVPATKFGAAVEEIHSIGGRILREKIAGQDVTEEYIDLEARIRTKRALELQFLEIMGQARKVTDALEVQTQLAEVRTEIERLEGRRRFLENQAALSTITVTLQTPAPLVAATTTGFWYGVKTAFGDGIDTAAEIILGVIRFVIVMIPVLLLIVLPGWYLFKWLRRYIAWPKRPVPSIGIASETE